MAFQDSAGNRFTNHSTMKQSESRLKAKAPQAAPAAAPEDPDMDGMQDDPQDVAMQHGPAVQVTISHAEGTHHVHSVHPDGHEHHSDHGSVPEAHEAAQQLATGDDGGEGEMPDDE